MKTWMKRMGWAAAWLVTVVALFYAVENWRGARAWKAYEAELRAKGEPLTIEEMLPERPPDELNMAMAPAYAGFFRGHYEIDPKTGATSWIPEDPEWIKQQKMHALDSLGPWAIRPELGTGADLSKALQTARQGDRPPRKAEVGKGGGARDILHRLEESREVFRTVDEAARRPFTHWPVLYDQGAWAAVPHINPLLGHAKGFSIRSVAHLHLGQVEAAYEDWRVMQRLAESIMQEPLLINHLVGITIQNISLNTVWEGLHRGVWSDAQLVDIQNRLNQTNWAASYVTAMRGERIVFSSFSNLRRHMRPSAVLGSDEERSLARHVLDLLFDLLPQGWIDQERKGVAQFHQNYSIALADRAEKRFHPAKAVAADLYVRNRIQNSGIFGTGWMMGMAVPAVDGAVARTAQIQALLQQASLACALELHRRRHGAFPERLDELDVDPQVRRDPVGEGDMIYRREPDGGYLLYSVGWNQKDDGGAFDPKKRTEGDWPWRMPGRAGVRR